MLIANPIYDTVFKRLMENRHSAKFFVEALIGEKLVDIAMVPQEYTYHTRVKKEPSKEKISTKTTADEWEVLSIVRYDFVATIRNNEGESKKVIIEIQKSNKPTDLLRFRAYLGEQYKRRDLVEVASGKVERSLPIICIFLLGFKIDGIETSAMRVDRRYFDMIKQCEIKQKSTWVESLTHDGYFVQIPRIEGKPLTILEKLLSVFEQQYFIDDKSTLKDYEYPIDDDNLKMMVEILQHAASDEKTRREMEEAWYSEENEKEYDRIKEELQKSKQSLAEHQKSLAEKDKEIAELRKLLENKIK